VGGRDTDDARPGDAGARAGSDLLHLLVDSTGLKLCGKGEWLLEKNGTATRRSWRALHLGVDAETGQIVASTALPSVSRTARLLLAENTAANTSDAAFVTNLLAKVPALADTIAAGKRLTLLLRRKSKEALATVLDAAGATMLRPFVTELRKDIGAVQAALDLPWTTSPVEGQISRLKMIKRTIYGRAGFSLLRARVLHAE